MWKHISTALVAAVALAVGAACEDITRSPNAERAEEIGEMHEEAAQRRAREEGKGWLDQQVAGEIARERGELATEAGQDPDALIDEPVQTLSDDLAEDDWYGKP